MISTFHPIWTRQALRGWAFIVVTLLLLSTKVAWAQDALASFSGSKIDWHGYDRYDFTMDNQTMEIQPFDAPASTGTGTGADIPGKRHCIVIVPKQVAAGNPWEWQGCYWDYEPQAEVELLHRGFFVTFITPDGGPQGPQWDAWYKFLTEKHGLAKKAVLLGMSKGGVNNYDWAVNHPDTVACIYADNPALYPQDFEKVHLLAEADVPVLHICGSFDYLLFHHTLPVEDVYHQLGGRITVMIKDGMPHHPHTLRDPKIIADWIEENAKPDTSTPFTLPGLTLIKSHYYSFDNTYTYFPKEGTYITCRGPAFTDCYDRYDAKAPEWNLTGATFILPKTPAQGNPWVLRANRIDRATPSAVDLGLLAKGVAIVAMPVDTQPGPSQKEWDDTYNLLVGAGFSKTPGLEGSGTGAGEAYAWALNHPDRVSCIYAENPYLRSIMFPQTHYEDLNPLFKAGIPLMHVCGSLDPLLKDNSAAVEASYKQLGGQITVILKDGVGHYPLEPADPQPVIDFIAKTVTK